MINFQEIKRKDWMFKLVGTEEFFIGKQNHKGLGKEFFFSSCLMFAKYNIWFMLAIGFRCLFVVELLIYPHIRKRSKHYNKLA